LFEEVLGDSFSVFIKNIRVYVLLVIIIMLPIMVLQMGVTIAAIGPESFTAQSEAINMFKNMDNPEEMEESAKRMEEYQQSLSPIIYFAMTAISVILMFMGVLLINAAFILATDDYYRSENAGLGYLLKRAAGKLPGIIGMAILLWLACMIGFILLIVPGIILAVKFSLALPIYVLEDVSVFAAISRSFQMTKGKAWEIFGVVLIMGILAGMVGTVAIFVTILPAVLLSSVIFYVFLQMISSLLQMLTGGIFVIVAYLFYAKISGRLPGKGKVEPEYLTA